MRARVISVALALGIAVWLWGLAWSTAPGHYDLAPLLLLAGVYLLLGFTLQRGSELARAIHEGLGAAASLAIGGVLVWHCREQLWLPARPLSFLAAAAAAAVLHYAVSRLAPPPQGLGRSALRFGAPLALLLATLAASYETSGTFRWHLLRHNKLLGTPAYFALAQPVKGEEEALWARHGANGDCPPPPSAQAQATSPGPHLVFVLVDTLRADSLSAYGGDPGAMPRLNQFAAGSLVFADVQANASWTRPSVASFFTGLLQERHGAVDRDDRLPERVTTLAEVLAGRGYETAAFVSNFAAVGKEAGFAQGFETFRELSSRTDPYARAGEVNRATLDWLRSRGAAARPLFLYVHYLDPHAPYLSGGTTSGDHRVAYDAYRRELGYVDDHIARLLEGLALRLRGPRMVLVTSDHGEEFGEHGERGHGRSLYREVIHLPAVLAVTGGEPGRVEARLEQRDFFDLLLDLAERPGLDIAEWALARSRRERYASVYTGTDVALHRPYLRHVAMRSLERGADKLIWSGYGSTLELYDLASDPSETYNLAARRRADVAAFQKGLDDHVTGWCPRISTETSQETRDLLKALGYVQ